MTIIVIDQFRTAADTVAEVSVGSQTRIETGFQKVHLVPEIEAYQGHKFHNTIAFTGSAVGYLHFLQGLKDTNLRDFASYLARAKISVGVVQHEYQAYSVIFPVVGGAYVIDVEPSGVSHRLVKGDQLVFGAGHCETSESFSNKSWYMVFLDAYRAKKLSCLDVNVVYHEEYPDRLVHHDHIMNDDESKQHYKKRRNPFRRLAKRF